MKVILILILAAVALAQSPVLINGTNGTAAVKFYVDPCQRGAKTYGSFSGTTNTQLISGTSSLNIYFCSWNDQNGGTATNYAIVEGTGSVCGTGTAAVPGISGGTTAATGWNTAANGGRVIGNGAAAIGATATLADNVCVLVSAANQLNIGYSYVKF